MLSPQIGPTFPRAIQELPHLFHGLIDVLVLVRLALGQRQGHGACFDVLLQPLVILAVVGGLLVVSCCDHAMVLDILEQSRMLNHRNGSGAAIINISGAAIITLRRSFSWRVRRRLLSRRQVVINSHDVGLRKRRDIRRCAVRDRSNSATEAPENASPSPQGPAFRIMV